ncbi:MAG: DUF885 domain-containing protein [Deltaproteobacteria bacterium]|nr:DUF885 domain-containing protein [Deltaproteobacteria bacterium]
MSDPLADQITAGITDPALAAAATAHWAWVTRWQPVLATTLGDHRFDDRLAPRDRAAIRRCHDERRDLLGLLGAIDAGPLDAADRLTLMMLAQEVAAAGAADLARLHEWHVSPRGGLFEEFTYLVEIHPLATPTDGDNLLARLRDAATAVEATIANLTVGVRNQRVAPRLAIARTIAQLDAELARPVDTWAMLAPAQASLSTWPAEARARFAAALRSRVVDELRPALVVYRDFLERELLPLGRTGADEGLRSVRGGEMGYFALIQAHLGEPRDPAELHALGLEELARTDAAIAALGAELFGAPDLAATLAHLRADPAGFFASGEEIVTAAQAALDRAQAAVPACFRALPRTPCIMREIPPHEAPYTTTAYYRQPHLDGSKPGEYFVNTFEPATRPRWELEALTYHESVPGHHLQIARAMELEHVPLFRRISVPTGYVEGWALYTERLADELGLYSGPLDRLGMHSYDAWRGSRLVVDTGLHAMGWTRDQAEQFMRAHTALSFANIANEVDRYISDPAQALAYKVGQLTMFELRDQAKATLGARFELADFHEVVLATGGVSLPGLRMVVAEWLRTAGGDGHAHDHDHDHDHDH